MTSFRAAPRPLLLAAGWLVALALSACGQKGPLYLPTPPKSKVPAPPAQPSRPAAAPAAPAAQPSDKSGSSPSSSPQA